MYIKSEKNKIIKEINSLKLRKNRDKLGLFIVEGERLTKEAKDYILYTVAEESYKGNIKADYIVSDLLFSKICDTVTPQGIMAVCKKLEYKLEKKENPLYICLENLQDPGNLGTIIRTADAAGADGVFLSKGCVDIYNPKVVRGAMGSLFHIPIFTNYDLYNIIEDENIISVAAHLKGNKTPYEINMKKGVAILIGNEGNGLSDEISKKAKELCKIPMIGKAESMNASVAASIMIYEAVRQRL
ncbi:MAG: TrmH family RNA methyltransferase [Lachnospirales bacterium]